MNAARGEKTRDELVAAAAEIFDREGFDGASLDRVCAKAGVTKGALYSHFPSKSALAAAVVHRFSPPWGELACRIGRRRLGPTQTLIDLSFEVARSLETDVAHQTSLRLSLHADLFACLVPAQFACWVSVVRKLLFQASRAGELRGDVDLRRAAEAIVAELVGTQLASQAAAGTQDLTDRVSWMWRQRLPGLVTPELADELRLGVPGRSRGKEPG